MKRVLQDSKGYIFHHVMEDRSMGDFTHVLHVILYFVPFYTRFACYFIFLCDFK